MDFRVIQGPALFLIYINILPELNISGKLYLFVDNTALVFTGDLWDQDYDRAATDLSKLKHWFDNS